MRTRQPTWATALLVATVVTASCSPGAAPSPSPSAAAPSVPGVPVEVAPTGGGVPGASAGSVPPAPPGAAPATVAEPTQPDGPAPPPPSPPAATAEPAGPQAIDDSGGVGDLCRDYLRADIPALTIELDAQAGAAPDQAAIDHLVGVLTRDLAKPGGIELITGEIPGNGPPGGGTWTLETLRAAADASRDLRSTTDRLVLHVLSVGGGPDNDSIGVAFDASTFAIYPERIAALSDLLLLGGSAAVQRAVVAHEAGHLLCLVGIGYEAPREDPEHPGHTTDRASVMFHAIETSAIAQLFTGPPPADFTAEDRADLEALRAG